MSADLLPQRGLAVHPLEHRLPLLGSPWGVVSAVGSEELLGVGPVEVILRHRGDDLGHAGAGAVGYLPDVVPEATLDP